MSDKEKIDSVDLTDLFDPGVVIYRHEGRKNGGIMTDKEKAAEEFCQLLHDTIFGKGVVHENATKTVFLAGAEWAEKKNLVDIMEDYLTTSRYVKGVNFIAMRESTYAEDCLTEAPKEEGEG